MCCDKFPSEINVFRHNKGYIDGFSPIYKERKLRQTLATVYIKTLMKFKFKGFMSINGILYKKISVY